MDTLIEDVLTEMASNIHHNDRIESSEQKYLSKMSMLSHFLKIWDKLSMLVSETIKDRTDIVDTVTNMFNKLVLPKLILNVDSKLAYVDSKMGFEDIINISDDIWRVFVEECFKDKTFMIDNLKQQSLLAYIMLMSIKEQIFADVKMSFEQPINLINKIVMEKNLEFSFDTSIIDALSEDVSIKLTNHHYVTFSDWLDVKYFLHPDTIMTIHDELMMREVTFEQKAALDLVDALVVSVSEASVRHNVTLTDRVKEQATMVLGSSTTSQRGFTNVIRVNYLGESIQDENSTGGAVVYTLDSPAIFIAGNNTVEDNYRQGDSISLRDTLKIIYE
jgi:hypothetical protein